MNLTKYSHMFFPYLTVSDAYLSKKMDKLTMNDDSSNTLSIIRKFLNELNSATLMYTKTMKDVFNRVVKDRILKNCKESHSELISTFEYAGNLHERLITESQDDDDVVVLAFLKTKKNNGDVKPEVYEGYAKFQVIQGSYYMQFIEDGLYVNPGKLADWFFKQVQREVQKCSDFAISLTPPQSGKDHVVKLTIKLHLDMARCPWKPEQTLTINILPAFVVGEQVFVPLEPQNGVHKNSCNRWKQSFAIQKKAILQNMDKDSGCRHDLYKVATTVLKREPTFSPVLAHVKMMFIVYMNRCSDWSKDKLAERFDDFMRFIAESLQKKDLRHYWLKDVNLLSSIPEVALHNMETRILRILSSQQEKEKVLTFLLHPLYSSSASSLQ